MPTPAPIFPARRIAANIDCPGHVHWLFPGRIVRSGLTLIVGDPGVGKSIFATHLAAHVTSDSPWPEFIDPQQRNNDPPEPITTPMPLPDAEPAANPPQPRWVWRPVPATALIVATEDDIWDTQLPRLRAAGANLKRTCLLHGVSSEKDGHPEMPLQLPQHFSVLVEALNELRNTHLLVLDPLSAFLAPGETTSASLLQLAKLAQECDIALVAIAHLRKSDTRNILHRISGPLALASVARSILLIERCPDDPDARILHQIKSVRSRLAAPLRFRICEGPLIEWTAPPLVRDTALVRDSISHPLPPESLPASAAGARFPSRTPAEIPRQDAPPLFRSASADQSMPPALAGGFETSAETGLLSHSSRLQPDFSTASATSPEEPPSAAALSSLTVRAPALRRNATDWLIARLQAGPAAARALIAEAHAAGYSLSTMRRAKRRLGIQSLHDGTTGRWRWTLRTSEQGCQRGVVEPDRLDTLASVDASDKPANGAIATPERVARSRDTQREHAELPPRESALTPNAVGPTPECAAPHHPRSTPILAPLTIPGVNASATEFRRRRMLVLANSYKNIPGRCVAGREIAPDGTLGPWLRPISAHGGGELLADDCSLDGGGSLALLDIVDVPLTHHLADETHPEDWQLAAGVQWQRLDAFPHARLATLEEPPADLWLQPGAPTDRVSREHLLARMPRRSIMIIRPSDLRYELSNAPSPAPGEAKRQRRACFNYRSVEYALSITDPDFIHRNQHPFPRAGDAPAVHRPACGDNCLLCVSVTPLIDGWHHKVVAAVIELP